MKIDASRLKADGELIMDMAKKVDNKKDLTCHDAVSLALIAERIMQVVQTLVVEIDTPKPEPEPEQPTGKNARR